MNKLLIARIIGGLMGIIALISGAKAVWQGASGKLGEAAATLDPNILQALDSDFRYFAGVWLFTAVVYIVGTIVAPRIPHILQVAFELTIFGGFARAFAYSEFGFNGQFLPPILIEIIPPLVGFILLKMATREDGQEEQRQPSA